jgi:hypothetical protein
MTRFSDYVISQLIEIRARARDRTSLLSRLGSAPKLIELYEGKVENFEPGELWGSPCGFAC